MPVTRMFLDWHRPALITAADYLLDRYTNAGAADLSGAVIVVPGRRAGRRLMELLIEAADERQVRLTPPPVETVGRLPERLYKAQRRFAGDLVNKLAWTAALRALDDEDLRTVIPDPPQEHDISRWLSFGELVWKQHRELAAEGLDFQHVIQHGEELSEFNEGDRWKVLRSVQESCLAMLDEMELWDLQSARLFAIQHEECETDQDIILVGTADLNMATREMLSRVSDRVTTLVHAPEELHKRFDDFGCIIPDEWMGIRIDPGDECICVCDGPSDQAKEVARTLAERNGRFRVDEVTIGVADEQLVPEIRRVLSASGVETRWVIGQQLCESRPYRLLKAVADYIDNEQFQDFASLVRHTDLDRWLCRQCDSGNSEAATERGTEGVSWLNQLDEYFSERLPSDTGQWPDEDDVSARLHVIQRHVSELLEPLMSGSRTLNKWVQPITQLLLTVYRDVEFNIRQAADSFALESCRKIHELLLSHEDIPPRLLPRMSSTQAIRLLLAELSAESVPPVPNDDAVEMLGWLELPLDDSPALVVTSFNDGYVPGSLNSDAFLPNAMRRHLGLLDNRRRYARDAYALSVLMASRQQLRLITGRRDLRGDPLRPSRLLFAADERQIAARVLRCFAEAKGAPAPARSSPIPSAALNEADQRADTSQLKIPRPQPLNRPIERISVTAFRTYLACPYRFYLQHILRLRDVDDTASELSALSFGNVMHEVLHRFGTGPYRTSVSAADIRAELRKRLAEVAEEQLAGARLAAVNVQLRQLEMRLDAFADWQANRTADGWVIQHSELSFRDKDVLLDLGNGRNIRLDGRIDRIDQMGSTGRYAIFDYKSGEKAMSPRQTHRKKDTWTDLQLPLYRYMAQQIGLSGELNLGYITLPKDTGNVKESTADFDEPELDSALQKAVEVATCIVDERFWPPQDDGPVLYSEFSSICQDGAFDREVVA